jgi:hypothetical protein
MVFFRDIGVGRHDLTPQNSTLLLRVKSVVRLDLTQKILISGRTLTNMSVSNYKNIKYRINHTGVRIVCFLDRDLTNVGTIILIYPELSDFSKRDGVAPS